MQSEFLVNHATVHCLKSMPADQHNKCDFHEVYSQQNGSGGHSKERQVNNKSELKSSLNLCCRKQRNTSWSSSSSSLSTGSLFSLPDSSTSKMPYKTTGVLFGNLDRVPYDPEIDPKPYACYNCWHYGHQRSYCPYVKSQSYCGNCGRRGVVMKECPRCARGLIDYLDRSGNNWTACVSRVKMEEPVQDVQLNTMQESHDDSWDHYDEYNYTNLEVNFSDSLDMNETKYQSDDWDNYLNPRENIVEKSTELYTLNVTKEEVAKCKDDNWSDCEEIHYSYSWEEITEKVKNTSFNLEEGENEIEDWDDLGQDASEEYSQDVSKNIHYSSSFASENPVQYNEDEPLDNSYKGSTTNLESVYSVIGNEMKAEIYIESKFNENDFKNMQEDSTIMCQAANSISIPEENTVDQNNWSDENETCFKKAVISSKIHFQDQKVIAVWNANIQIEKESQMDVEDYHSLRDSFCEDSEIGNSTISLNDTIDEEYWTDFDDDYQSLQTSFAEEYKSLDNTMEDENDSKNTFMNDSINSEDMPELNDSFCTTVTVKTNEWYSLIENEKEDDLFTSKHCYQRMNSLESSVCSQSDEAYLSNEEEGDDYEYTIVDEDEKSEHFPFAGQAVQDFLNLLEKVKHLPIQTQNVAVLHFISNQKDQSWQSQL